MKFEKGDEVFLVQDSPDTEGKFYDYGVEYGDRGIIRDIRESDDEFDYFVEFESYKNHLLVAKDEISRYRCEHKCTVYSSSKETWICPFCEL